MKIRSLHLVLFKRNYLKKHSVWASAPRQWRGQEKEDKKPPKPMHIYIYIYIMKNTLTRMAILNLIWLVVAVFIGRFFRIEIFISRDKIDQSQCHKAF